MLGHVSMSAVYVWTSSQHTDGHTQRPETDKALTAYYQKVIKKSDEKGPEFQGKCHYRLWGYVVETSFE